MAVLFFEVKLDFLVEVVGVQQVMRFLAARLSVELLVDRYDLGVLVGLAQRHLPVGFVDCLMACPDYGCVSVMERLAGAVDAAAGACHDLHEVIRAVACLDLLHDGAGVLEAVNDGHLKVYYTGNRNGSFADAVQAADLFEVELDAAFLGNDLTVGGPVAGEEAGAVGSGFRLVCKTLF